MKVTIEISPEEVLKLTGAEMLQKVVQEAVQEAVKKTYDPSLWFGSKMGR